MEALYALRRQSILGRTYSSSASAAGSGAQESLVRLQQSLREDHTGDGDGKGRAEGARGEVRRIHSEDSDDEPPSRARSHKAKPAAVKRVANKLSNTPISPIAPIASVRQPPRADAPITPIIPMAPPRGPKYDTRHSQLGAAEYDERAAMILQEFRQGERFVPLSGYF